MCGTSRHSVTQRHEVTQNMSASFRLCLGVCLGGCLAAVHFAMPFNISAQEAPNSKAPQIQRDREASQVAFERVEDAFLSVPVRINDRIDTNFILDTGVGVTILS